MASLFERVLKGETGPDLLYTVAVPVGYSPNEPVPLILALHYGWPSPGPPPPFFGKGVLLGLVRPALAGLGAIVVAPDCPARDWTNHKSEAAVLELLESLAEIYPVDQDRILLTGFSLGGMGTWYLAARQPARFSAAIPIAAVPPEAAIEELEGIPLYVIHSRQDELMPIERTEAAVNQLRARGNAVEFVAVEAITHYETYRFVDPLQEAVPWVRATWARRQEE
jgi:predicted peptidase